MDVVNQIRSRKLTPSLTEDPGRTFYKRYDNHLVTGKRGVTYLNPYHGLSLLKTPKEDLKVPRHLGHRPTLG